MWVPECNECGDSDDVSGPDEDDEYHCSHCDHYIDEDGDCVTSDCSTCEREDEQIYCRCGQLAARDCRYDLCGSCCDGQYCPRHGDWVPECGQCDSSHDVTGPDEDGEYYCGECDHYIDEDGDCLTDSCETCDAYEEPDVSSIYCPSCCTSNCEVYVIQREGVV
ncbi:MAG: hypothetical protein CMB50_04415 [Euryarchaeota archaeon]|nr:hypothetical protein [Euryarchaeota archaeon]